MRPDLSRALVLVLAALLAACGTSTQRPERNERTTRAAQQKSAADLNVQLGQGYLEQGRYEIALEKLLKAIELDPRSHDAHTVIAVLYEQIGDPVKAETHYRRAAELRPKSGVTLNNYGTFLCRAGKHAEADGYFERALADPFYATPAVAHANRGICALEAGKLDVAETELRQASRLQPEAPDTLYAMARLNFATGDLLRARAFVQRYEAQSPASAEALGLGYDIERGLGNAAAAAEYRQRLLAEFPDSDVTRRLERSSNTP